MRFNCCSSCIYFRPEIVTVVKRIPKHCAREVFKDIFGPDAGGFPLGIDIIHCDYHVMHSPYHGHVAIVNDDGSMVSYCYTSSYRGVRWPQLFDNSKNIKFVKHERKINKGDCPY